MALKWELPKVLGSTQRLFIKLFWKDLKACSILGI